jgi:ATP-dependent DNA helicase PIF1
MKHDADQQAALGRINEGRNVFVTGPAGTGKSSVTVEAIRQRLGKPGLRVCATTGVAALNLRDKLQAMFGEACDTSTIYRWAGIGIGPQRGQSIPDYFNYMRGRGRAWDNAQHRIKRTATLILDEVSMLPGAILELVDYVCRAVRKDDRPFGGIQVIAVGDFLQLPPVSKTGKYDWAFEHRIWTELGFSNVTLRTIHRQDEPEFIRILNDFRNGMVSRDSAGILKSRIAEFPDRNLLRLMTHNVQVNKWNEYQLGTLDGDEIVFNALVQGNDIQCEWLRKNLVTPDRLAVKVGARVMVTANITNPNNSDELLAANGDIGTLKKASASNISATVLLDSGRTVELERHTWEFDPTEENSATFKQIPLRVAYACTIHKSQGLTLDAALIDIRAAREPGQAYTAISRVRTLGGLYLKDWFAGMFVSIEARDFHKRIADGYSLDNSAPKLTLTA